MFNQNAPSTSQKKIATSAARFYKHCISRASDKAALFPDFGGDFCIALLPPNRVASVNIMRLAPFKPVSTPHHALRSVLENTVLCVLGHCCIDTLRVRHMSGSYYVLFVCADCNKLKLQQKWKSRNLKKNILAEVIPAI